jgi:hypothetical protein
MRAYLFKRFAAAHSKIPISTDDVDFLNHYGPTKYLLLYWKQNPHVVCFLTTVAQLRVVTIYAVPARNCEISTVTARNGGAVIVVSFELQSLPRIYA